MEGKNEFISFIFKCIHNFLIFCSIRLYTVIIYGYKMYIDEFLPFVVPMAMWLLGGDHSLTITLQMFGIILISGGLFYGIVAIHAGHHHPNILHDGDAIR